MRRSWGADGALCRWHGRFASRFRIHDACDRSLAIAAPLPETMSEVYGKMSQAALRSAKSTCAAVC
jgi:hypothetical protein